ncbi:GntR family transcriptional regulator [Cryptosporangium aurantiacum]|uniref:GntR family transcriptional regulator n=1 Tax=Cryptosporangium aurantiacum TaxID=134849 RepID=A0A1M7RJY5_9ACTN|nr:GntR family transcriptional regulator [Cryptosporangium aurantiacum]SHN46456.1 GntR family transcriptional regulator [Cryptosporangium aurantiacum]
MAAIQPPKAQYQQVAALLRERIHDGTYTADQPLPSEPQLSAELGVSRQTINRAMNLLRSEGLVRVRRGFGTFIRGVPQVTRDAKKRYAARNQGTGAGDVEIKALGLTPRTEYVEIGRVPAPAAVATVLSIETGAPVLVRRRHLFANDEPTQLADSYIPWDIAEGTELLNRNVGRGGSYTRLAELGHGPVRFTEEVTVRTATDDEASLLELDGGQPVIDITHIAWDAADRPVEVALHVMPGNLWRLRYDWDDPTADEYPTVDGEV